MSLAAMSIGTLVTEPEIRKSRFDSRPFTVARMSAETGDGQSVQVSLVAFGSAGPKLAALTKGDSLAVSGRAKPIAWRDREGVQRAGLDLYVETMQTLYDVRHPTSAARPEPERPP